MLTLYSDIKAEEEVGRWGGEKQNVNVERKCGEKDLEEEGE